MLRLSMPRVLSCTGALLLCASAFASTTYTWSGGAAGDWSVASNWKIGTAVASDYPNTTDAIVHLPASTFTITLTEDITVGGFDTITSTAYIQPAIDLNGHTLTAIRVKDSVYYWNDSLSVVGNQTPNRGTDLQSCTMSFFGPGTVDFHKGCLPCMGNCSGAAGGGYRFADGVLFKGGFFNIGWQAGSRVFVTGGSTWDLQHVSSYLGNIRTSASDSHRLGAPYPTLCITGALSRVISTNKTVNIAGDRGDLYVTDGGILDSADLEIGGTSRSNDIRAHIHNGLVRVRGSLSLGTDAYTTSSSEAEVPNWPKGHDSKLMISGADSLVVVTNASKNFNIYENTGAQLCFTVPTVGFTNEEGVARAPLQVRAFVRQPRPFVDVPEYVADFGTTTVHVTSLAWMNACPKATVELMRAETDATELLTDLAANAVYDDIPDSIVAAGFHPTLSVSDDGKALQITAPEVPASPTLAGAGSLTDTMKELKVTATIASYGTGASSITGLTFIYATDSAFTDAVTTNILAGASPISGELVQTYSYVIAGWPQRTKYYAKLHATNNLGKEADSPVFTFTTGGHAETLNWGGSASGYWTNATKWVVGSYSSKTVANDWPHEEDTVQINNYTANPFYIRVTEDLSPARFCTTQIGQPVTLDGPGYKLYVANKTGASYDYLIISRSPGSTDLCVSEGNWKMPGASLTLNGVSLDYALNGNISAYCGYVLGSTGGAGAGATVISNATVRTKVIFWNSGSSMHVVDGGVFKSQSRDFNIPNHTARHPGGCLRIDGAGSLVDLGTYSIDFRSDRFGVYVLSGGKLIAKNFTVGGNNSCQGEAVNKPYVQTSEDTCAVIRDGTVTLSGAISLGTANERKQSPRLLLAGETALMSATGALSVYENLGVKLQFEVPANGWHDASGAMRAPLQPASLAIVTRTSGYTDYGATRVEIAMKAWSRLHGSQSQNLITLTTANQAALETLKSECVITDMGNRLDGFEAITISDDNKSLVLNAPPKKGAAVVIR